MIVREVQTPVSIGAHGAKETAHIARAENIVDDELDDVADAYLAWLAEMTTPKRKQARK